MEESWVACPYCGHMAITDTKIDLENAVNEHVCSEKSTSTTD
jgi:transcription elongation factor Elf1